MTNVLYFEKQKLLHGGEKEKLIVKDNKTQPSSNPTNSLVELKLIF